ncbi:MAG TPA: sugar phosphate isomerase/epimerase [Limnochordia bacterium]|nr:sugar phosphate isomerase/epimerase [Limnochordia bacterium]
MIAAQLYTLREHLKTPDQIATTLRKVREIGYEAVQLSALGPIETGRLKEILDENGLAVCATHIAWERLQNDIQGVIDEHRTLGCRHVAIGSMPPAYRNEEGYHRFAKEASEVAKALDGAGMTFSYHNHHFELERFGSKTGLDILIEESDPLLKFEIDTYWIQYGGGDPAAWIRKVGGRNPLVHLKDLTVKNAEVRMAEVGEGNLNWEAILAACRESGVEWYIIEQDHCDRDPFESLAISLNNAKAMGLG